MKRLTLLIALLAVTVTAAAQAIIDLETGAVRAKTIDDYRAERQPLAATADSLQYYDNLRRAYTFLHTDSLAAAERLFRDCLRLRPNAPGNHIVRHSLGLIARSQGRPADAARWFTEVLRQYPNEHASRMERAAAYIEACNAKACLDDCQLLARVAEADSLRERVHFLRGAAEMQLQQYVAARADFEEVIHINPANRNAPLLLAMALEQEGRPAEALQRLNDHLALHPDDAPALSLRSRNHAAAQRWAAARADLDRLIALRPNDRELYAERARILIALKQSAAARADLDRAVKLGTPSAALKDLYRQCR